MDNQGSLADEVVGLRVKRRDKHLVTSPKEIAKHRARREDCEKAPVEDCKKYVDDKVVVVRVGRTDVIVRLVD